MFATEPRPITWAHADERGTSSPEAVWGILAIVSALMAPWCMVHLVAAVRAGTPGTLKFGAGALVAMLAFALFAAAFVEEMRCQRAEAPADATTGRGAGAPVEDPDGPGMTPTESVLFVFGGLLPYVVLATWLVIGPRLPAGHPAWWGPAAVGGSVLPLLIGGLVLPFLHRRREAADAATASE